MIRILAAVLCAFAAPFACAASSASALTPINVSVLGNETRTFSARFLDSAGRPSVGEAVTFMNDACGTFANGGSVTTARTDANGVASAAFTAYNQGITCWLVASAGASVQFNVLTYTAGLVYLTGNLSPLQPRPGQPFSLTAAAMVGVYKLYDQDLSVRVIPGTGSATITPATANTGDSGNVAFSVTPDAHVGDYQIELTWRGKSQRLPVKAPANPWQDMWWSGLAENGWGVSVVQHGDTLFNVVYAYDAAGKPTWFVMPGGTWNAAKSQLSGALYRPRGAPYSAYDSTKFTVGSAIGNATLTFVDGGNVTLDCIVDGVAVRKSLTRQLFGPQDPAAMASDLGDMWWGGAAQNGWGIAVLQQYRTLFGVWFTYDSSGAPTWFVMPSGYWSDPSTYEGRMYRTTGSPWLGGTYDATAFRSADVGPFRMRFSADGSASLDYTIDGHAGTQALSRQPF